VRKAVWSSSISLDMAYLGHKNEELKGVASVCIQVAERRLHHTQQSSIAASPQVFLVNSAYFEPIGMQPLQTIRATD
jgi:hypothetical protein